MAPSTVKVTLAHIAKMIDHALLHPTMTDEEIRAGLEVAKKYNVATVCIKPYSIPVAKSILAGSIVGICPVIGFPHGNSITDVKVFEAGRAAKEGGTEIDMVVNVGKALSGEWAYVEEEIRRVNDAVVNEGALLKVIFENDYLTDKEIIRLCEICTNVGVAFVKTSTGFGFVKGKDGRYSYEGATVRHLKLMKEHVGSGVQIKAAGGVRTLDELLVVMSLGVTRLGTSATVAIMEEAIKREIGEEEVEVEI
ncbi:MAG: hypothetical protein M1835_006975 [Candelina submexicana]|nr:MAG: hypothetical protein M1835_006975 [Candelina submexicana]